MNMHRIKIYRLLPGLLLLLWSFPAQAQTLPRCDTRPGWHGLPRANPVYYCYEEVITETSMGEMPFTALAFAPDGRLFATRPLYGQVWMLHDTDGDFQPDSPQIAAENLTLPNALVYHDNALYIAAGKSLYRLPNEGELETLVDDLPAGTGFWTGGLAIGPDERIYVGIGAPCDFCEWDNPERGSILSFRLDGTDRQMVAQGFRHPAALAFWNGDLYAGDSAHESVTDWGMDEINHVVPGAHYGFPYCAGYNNAPDMPSDTFDCAQTVVPLLMVPTQSLPVAILPYTGTAFPNLAGKMLLALAGSTGQVPARGYLIYAVDLNTLDDPLPDTATLIPYDNITTPGSPPVYYPAYPQAGLFDPNADLLNQRGAGLWPHRIYGMAISPEGWIYFSVGGGKIASLRPM